MKRGSTRRDILLGLCLTALLGAEVRLVLLPFFNLLLVHLTGHSTHTITCTAWAVRSPT